MMKWIGLTLFLLGAAGMGGEITQLKVPSASWFFDTSRRLPFLNAGGFPWFGWVSAVLAVVVGVILCVKGVKQRAHPSSLRRQKRFRAVRRGVWSLRLLVLFVLLAGSDFLLVGNKPLALNYEGEWCFPAFERKNYLGSDFGLRGEEGLMPVNFRELLRRESGLSALMPLIPYAPTGDTLPPVVVALSEKDGEVKTSRGTPYSGLAARLYEEHSAQIHLRYRYRTGLRSGAVDGWNAQGERVYGGIYKEGELIESNYYGKEPEAEFFASSLPELYRIDYHPAAPHWKKRHYLGTTSEGYDVLAYLFGGLQVNIQAALFYIPFVYLIGVSIGLLMGYFGGIFDIFLQRLIEAFEAIPFLYVVIIVSAVVPAVYKGLGVIVLILVLFGWTGMTYLMRTAALKEKARDYTASARVIGASNRRVIFSHLLPNTVAILVTIIPFSVSGIITAITSLDYLGFGLPAQYASWGKLLNDGLNNLSAPWLVSAAFFALVSVLVLVTFVGEAVREAFDPRQFTTYR